MASNLRRSKRTVGKKIGELDRRVTRLQKKTVPTSIASGTVTNTALSVPVSTAISAAQLTADGKNAIFYSNDLPIPTSLAADDIWFNTADNYKMYRAVAAGVNTIGPSAWVQAVVNGNNITAGTIDANLVNVSNLNAGSITAGTLSSIQIQAGAPSGGNYPFSVNTSGVLRAASGTVGGFTLSSSTISANYSISDVIETRSGTLTLSTSGTIASTFSFTSTVAPDFYTNVTINDYSAFGGGSIVVEGTASLSYAKTAYTASGAYPPSDIRLKDVSAETIDALEILSNIEPILFSFKRDETKTMQYGFSAQQVYEHIPIAVRPGGEDEEEHPWSMSNEKFVPYLVRAIQQLSERVTALEEKNK